MLLVTGVVALSQAQIVAPVPNVDDATKRALLAAACDGKVEDDSCDTDLISGGESAWSLGTVHIGHFLAPESEDALATVQLGPGFSPRRYSTMGILLRKTEGEWAIVDGPVINSDFNDCRKLRFRNGREFLVCISEDTADFVRSQQLHMIWVAGEAMKFKMLLEATDDSAACNSGRGVEKASIGRVDFADRNNDGWLDLVIDARYGKMLRTATQQERCTPGERNPEPAMRRYKLDLLFDDSGFTAAPASRIAARLFEEKAR